MTNIPYNRTKLNIGQKLSLFAVWTFSTDIFTHTIFESLMRIAAFLQQAIPHVFVSGNEENIIQNSLPNTLVQGAGNSVLYDFGTHSAGAFVPSRAMLVFVRASNVGFVNFTRTLQSSDIATHGRSPAGAHVPSGVVVGTGVFAEDDPMPLQDADALSGHRHHVATLQPDFEWDSSVLKDGSSNHHEAIAVASATVRIFAERMKKLACFQGINPLFTVASRTLDALRPAYLRQKRLAGVLGLELLYQSVDGFHVSVSYVL